MGRALILSLITLLVIGALPASAAPTAARTLPGLGPAPQHDEDLSGAGFVAALAQDRKNPKMASSLVGVGKQAQAAGRAAAIGEAQAAGLSVKDDRVRVEILTDGANVGAAQAAVAQAGGTVEHSAAGIVQALVPPGALEQLATANGVQYVQPTRRLFPTAAVTGEEVGASGANIWQTSGSKGSGVKIAVLDGDFKGYQQRQASGDLPPLGSDLLVTKDICAAGGGYENGFDEGHGTAVAEVVHEMAPEAQLYLVCATTLSNMVDAIQYMKGQGVQVVNHSRGVFNTSRADGVYSSSDPPYLPESLITTAYNNGMLWVNSAGNSATTHWSGAWRDDDNDSVLNFTATDEGNDITLGKDASIAVSLKWDSWPTTTQDFDLYLSRISDGVVVASSVNDQSAGFAPIEDLVYTNRSGADQGLFISVVRFRATSLPARFDIFAQGTTSVLQYKTAEGSLTDFAVSPRALVVGATCWNTPTAIESYSSQGPTINPSVTGVKPDITGHDSVSSVTFGNYTSPKCGTSGFAGTSGAAPEVAGAAALVKGANPSFTGPQLQEFLEGRSTDQGAARKDTVFGAGVLALGAFPTATCTPRPPVTISNTVTSGALVTSVTANNSASGNSLVQIQFGADGKAPVNAVLSLLDGRANLTGATSYTPPSGTTTTTFTTRRQTAGSPVTVPLVVVDACGPWKSFVGAGTGVTGF
jgi:hypothetical protein